MIISKNIQRLILAILFLSFMVNAEIGQSSIITLAFPWGARSTGLGETFTGVADDEQALFYNPAGLGQPPLSKTWLHYKPNNISTKFKIVTSQKASGFGASNQIWAITEDNLIFTYSGDKWDNYVTLPIDSNSSIRNIATKAIPQGDEKEINMAMSAIMKANKRFGVTQGKKISALLNKYKAKSITELIIKEITDSLVTLRPSLKNDAEIYTIILDIVQEDNIDKVSSDISLILNDGSELEDRLDVKLPLSIAFNSNINCLTSDDGGRLWFGTDNGIWRFDNSWKHFTKIDGLPSDTIEAIITPVDFKTTVATAKGVVTLNSGLFTPIKDLNIDSRVNAIAVNNQGERYIGSDNGLYYYNSKNEIARIDTSNGLLNNRVTSLFVDKRNRLWVGGPNGVSIFTSGKWQLYKFKGTEIRSIAQESSRRIWLATNNGAVEYIEATKSGEAPQWKVHHSNNDLKSTDIYDVIQDNGNIWIATSNGIEQYKHGEVRGTVFFEQLLPSLGIDDMWHATLAGIVPMGEWGTIGFFVNNLFFGEITSNSADGSDGANSLVSDAAFEIVSALSYGLPIKQDFSLGLNLKYAYSRLQKNVAEAQTFAFDAGLLKNNLFTPRLSLGVSMLNIGFPVWYAEEDNKDPIPFTIRGGIGYTPLNKKAYKLLVTVDFDREFVHKDSETGEVYPFWKAIWYDIAQDSTESFIDELQQVIVHGGAEFSYLDFIKLRFGGMYDHVGKRQELNLGLGVQAKPVLADFSIIFALGDNDVRNNQVRFSLTYAK